MLKAIKADLAIIKERDPAARGLLEMLLCYPGFHALLIHRLAHRAWIKGQRLRGRLISHIGRRVTGIEIHPGAKIGKGVFIDHGMGVVIGETAVVGDNVSLLHGVTLGGTGKDRGNRHPKIGEGTMIGAGAAILGNITVGVCCRIGAGSVVLKNIADNTTVAGVPAKESGETSYDQPAILMDQKF